MEIIGPRLKVPANSSRLFEGWSEALNQEPGIIQLGYEDSDPNRWDRYLKLTKCAVFSPEKALKFMTFETLVLVAHPNH